MKSSKRQKANRTGSNTGVKRGPQHIGQAIPALKDAPVISSRVADAFTETLEEIRHEEWVKRFGPS